MITSLYKLHREGEHNISIRIQ